MLSQATDSTSRLAPPGPVPLCHSLPTAMPAPSDSGPAMLIRAAALVVAAPVASVRNARPPGKKNSPMSMNSSGTAPPAAVCRSLRGGGAFCHWWTTCRSVVAGLKPQSCGASLGWRVMMASLSYPDRVQV